MTEEPHNLILDYLRELREGQKRIETSVRDIKSELVSIRHHMHAADSDNLRQDNRLGEIETRLERIENRLDLTDA